MALLWCEWCDDDRRGLGEYLVVLRGFPYRRHLCAPCVHHGLDDDLIASIQHPNPWPTSPPKYERTWTSPSHRSSVRRARRRATSSTSTSEPSPPKANKADPNQLTLGLDVEVHPPQPRKTIVHEHTRRNPHPRRSTMTTATEPESRTEVTALKDAQAQARASDPVTSHEAAKVATRSLRRRMADVLQTFQWEATKTAKSPGAVEGLTDEDLQRCFTNYTFKGSPSGVRTARKDLCREGLLEPKMLGEIEDTRPTALGNPAIVYVLTDAGAAFDLHPGDRT